MRPRLRSYAETSTCTRSSRKDPDVVLAHLAAQVPEHLVTVVELDTEMAALEGFNGLAFEQDGVVL